MGFEVDKAAVQRSLVEYLGAPLARKNVTDMLPELAQAVGNVSLFVEELTPEQYTRWLRDNTTERARQGDNGKDSSEARLVILTLCYEDGVRVFQDTPNHRELLCRKLALVTKLAKVAGNLSGILWREEDALKNARQTSPSNGQPHGEAPV